MSQAPSIASVLVADDHGVTRFGLTQFLREKLGARVVLEAPRFEEAMEILRNQSITLAVFDLHIPGLKSARDLAQVREQWPDMRVVVLSASNARANILAALEAGVHGYIVKTESMDDLADRLRYVMAGNIYVPPCLAERDNGGEEVVSSSGSAKPAANGSQPKLTLRQRQVLRAIVKGHSNKQIAKDLKLAVGTVKMHVSGVLMALGAQNRSHAASLGRAYFD